MQKLFLFFLSNLLISIPLFAGSNEYAVSNINPSLLTNADAVVRSKDISFEILSSAEAIEKNHYVITIMNENGDEQAALVQAYDQLQQIISIEGYLYDVNGKQLKKIKTKDVEDVSGVDDNNLMDDNRIKHHDFYHKVYPYTIEYDIAILHKNTLFFPVWIPQEKENIAVEHSQIAMVSPPNYSFRYKMFHYEKAPVVTTENGKEVTKWSVEDMPAMRKEVQAPSWYELTTHIIFGPTDFEVEHYQGNMSTWQDFGKFVYALKQGRDVLPATVKQAVHQISDSIIETKRKVQVLYEYLQRNTRYISIQLGIGGWQPFDASYVAAKGYGDCKALTNYMYSILKEANIPSYYTLIKAGENADSLITDFPSQQFNHVILCVPTVTDTIWLECTSQTLPAGYVSSFTSNRYGLLINENGGTLVRTPVYDINTNLQIRKIKAVLDKEGMLSAGITTVYKAESQDILHEIIHLSKDKLEKILKEKFDISTYNIVRFNYQEYKTELPIIQETLDLTVSNYATITDKRLFIVPNLMTRSARNLKTEEQRKYAILLRHAYTEKDTIEIDIPPGYTLECIPQPVILKTQFGKYSNVVKITDGKIYYYRNMEQYRGTFSAKLYIDMANFYNTIYKADQSKIVFVKKEDN